LSEDSALEREVIHHVDSAYGILLVVVVLLFNIVFSSAVESGHAIEGTILTSLLAFVIMTGLLGVLRQSWRWKLYSWNVLFFILLAELEDCILTAIKTSYGITTTEWLESLLTGLLILPSSLLTRYLVFEAYYQRLFAVVPKGIQIEKLKLCRASPFKAAVIVFLVVVIPSLLSM